LIAAKDLHTLTLVPFISIMLPLDAYTRFSIAYHLCRGKGGFRLTCKTSESFDDQPVEFSCIVCDGSGRHEVAKSGMTLARRHNATSRQITTRTAHNHPISRSTEATH
jgi:hypothetical protein